MNNRKAALRLIGDAELERVRKSRPEVVGCPTRERVRTSTGVEIGGAYVQRPPPMSDDMERLQRGFLRSTSAVRRTVAEVLFVLALFGGVGVGAFFYLSR